MSKFIELMPKGLEPLPVKDYRELLRKKILNNKNEMKELIMSDQNLKGIQETLDVLDFAASLINIVSDVTAEDSTGGSKVTVTELPAFFPLVFKIAPMVSGIKEVPAELLDKITDEEKSKIKEVIKKVKAIQNDADLDMAVNDFLEWALITKHLITKYIVK